MVIYPVAMDYPPFEQLEPGHVFLPLRQTISFLLIWNCNDLPTKRVQDIKKTLSGNVIANFAR